jgi:hypothetical protein
VQEATFGGLSVAVEVSRACGSGAPAEHVAYLWVTVQGLDETAALLRASVFRLVEGFVEERRPELVDGEFFFDYDVLIDDDVLGEPPIPHEARQLNAA